MTNPTKCPPGTKQVNTCLALDLIQQIHALHEARKRTAPLGWTPKIHPVIHDLIRYAIGAFDLATGYLKPVPREQLVVGILPHFDCSRFGTVQELIDAMDRSLLMLWASTINFENLHVTPALEAYLGHSAAEIRGRGWVELLHPDDRAVTLHNYDQRATRQEQSFGLVYRIMRSDGQYGLIVDYAQPFRVRNGKAGYVGMMHQFPPGSVVLLAPDQREARVITDDDASAQTA